MAFNNNPSFQRLIYKIIPSITQKHKTNIQNEIQKFQIQKFQNSSCAKKSLAHCLNNIDIIIESYKKHNTRTPLTRQNWICGQIVKYFKIHNVLLPSSIIDIGGGNGNVLHFFATKYKLPKQDCICIENKQPQPQTQQIINNNNNNNEFQYNFSHTDTITYKFLDDRVFASDNDTCIVHSHQSQVDCIVCMVSLHHMTDEYILNTVFPLIRNNLKRGGYLLLKEHNANSTQANTLIQWEHYLYYFY